MKGARHKVLPNALYHGWQKLKVFALPHRDCILFYAIVTDNWTIYKPIKAFNVASFVDFSNLMITYNDETEVGKSFIGRIGEVKFLLFALGAFLRTASSGTVLKVLFARLDKL